MQLSVRVRTEVVRQGLENLSSEIPALGRRRLRTVLERVKRVMEAYPEQRPGQRYRRTGKLFSGWRINKLSNNKGYSLGNVRDYSHFVVGNAYGAGQAWMHKGRWVNFRTVTEKELEAVPNELEKEIVMVARREGFDAK